MLKNRFCTWVVLLSTTVAASSGAEKSVAARVLSRAPAAVQKTVSEQVGSGKIISVDKNVDDGEVMFDLEMTRDGKTRGFTVAANGELVSLQVFLVELPAAVQKTIQNQIAKGTLVGIDKTTEDGETNYDVEFTRDSKTRSFSVGTEGDLLAEEVFLIELPAAVQKTIQDRMGTGTLTGIEKTVDDGEISYDVAITRGGQDRDFTVGGDGQLMEEQVFLSELPAALQTAIQARTAGGKLGEINKSIDDGETSYEVEIIQGGKTNSLTFDSEGNLSSEEEEISLAEAPEPVRKEIQSLAAGGKIAGVNRITAGKEISFDVDLNQNGKEKAFSIGTDGKLISSANGN